MRLNCKVKDVVVCRWPSCQVAERLCTRSGKGAPVLSLVPVSTVETKLLEGHAQRRMTSNVELTKNSIDSLHHRNTGRIYETRTPEGEPAVVSAAAKEQHHTTEEQHGDGLLLWDGSARDIKGKGRAITRSEDGVDGDLHSGSGSRSSIASEEDDELLPNFGGDDDEFDRPVSSSTVHKGSSSNSRSSSLGLHQNGFRSRDDMLERDDNDGDRDNLDDEKKHNQQKTKQSGSTGSKPKRRKRKDRYNAGRFAKEMAFVVSPDLPFE